MCDLGVGMSYCDDFLSPLEQATLVAAIDAVPAEDWAALPKRRLLNLGGVPHPSGTWTEAMPHAITGLAVERLVALGCFPASAPPNQVLLNEYARGAGIEPHGDGPLYLPTACIVSLESTAVIDFWQPAPTPAAPPASSEAGGSGGEGANETAAPPPTPPEEESQLPAKVTAAASLVLVRSVLLRPGSCLCFTGEHAYAVLKHGIASTEADALGSQVANLGAIKGRAGAAVTTTSCYSVGGKLPRGPRRLSLTLRRLARVERHIDEFDVLSDEDERERRRRQGWWLRSISEK